MRTLADKKDIFFRTAHQNGISWAATEILWKEARTLGVRDDTEAVGLVDGISLVEVSRDDGRINAVKVEEEGASFILTVPRMNGPHIVSDLNGIFKAIEESAIRRNDTGITRQRIMETVAAIQEAGFLFYTHD